MEFPSFYTSGSEDVECLSGYEGNSTYKIQL